ncbi:hypothetical protein [Streptomyces sp. NPDC058739]|uniref:hypothetical protein n=1 Tax=Streptomyces sp. NPDC058739 TaxID=3346618 RepID=UPI0036743043
MENSPNIAIEPPDSRGLRQVSADGEIVGSAWSLNGARRILRGLGYPRDINMEDEALISWRGGDSKTWPDHSSRRRATIAFMMAGLIASMALVVTIGMPDALRGLTFAGRVTGFLFVFAGLIQGLAASAVLDHWGKRRVRFSGAVVLLGALIAVAINSLLLLLWLQELEYTPYILAYAPLWCWSLGALWLLVREKTWMGIPHPRSFAAGITATAVIAGANLTYSSIYQPASQPMLVSLEARFGKPALDSRTSFIDLPLILHARNKGKVPAYIISNDYSVYGHIAKLSEVSSGLKDTKGVMENESGASRYTDEPENETINAGQFISPGWPLDPGEEYTAQKMIHIPLTAKYDTLEVYSSLTLMRKDRGRINEWEFPYPHLSWEKDEGRFYCPPDSCGESLIYHGEVQHNNNIINVTRRPRYVTSWWSLTPEDSSTETNISSFSFQPKDAIDMTEMRREMDRYGVANVYAEVLIPFAELNGLAN